MTPDGGPARPDAPKVAGEIVDAVAQEPRIVAAYLFGSWARGAATSLSDVDVALLLEAGCIDAAIVGPSRQTSG
jgi:predicted nucleotidyltransferase